MKTDFWIWVIIDIKRTSYQFHQIKMRINDSGWNFQCFVCVRSDRFVLLPLIAMFWVWLKEGVNTLSKISNVLVNFGIFQKVSAILEGNFCWFEWVEIHFCFDVWFSNLKLQNFGKLFTYSELHEISLLILSKNKKGGLISIRRFSSIKLWKWTNVRYENVVACDNAGNTSKWRHHCAVIFTSFYHIRVYTDSFWHSLHKAKHWCAQ